MTTFIVVVGAIIFAIIASALWGVLIDGTVKRPPSEWLSLIYLGVFAGLVGASFMLLDQIRSHLGVAIPLAILAFGILIWVTVVLWSKVKKLDESYYAKHGRKG